MKQKVLAKCFVGAAASLLLGFPLVNCGNNPGAVGGLGGSNGGGGIPDPTTSPIILPDASTGNRGGGGTGDNPTPDANCGVQTSKTTKSPADVLLVLDRSGSMTQSIAGDCCCVNSCARSTGKDLCTGTATCSERWPALTAGVTATISKTPDINWGLKFFATKSGFGDTSCGVSNTVEVAVAPAATSAGAIQSQIANASPGSATPTAKALTVATTYLGGIKDDNNRVILLATDGEPNCAGGNSNKGDLQGTQDAAAAALAAGFKVYVIGIGPSLNNLTAIAQAGGTGNYYQASSPDALAQALDDIAKAVASCTFTMDTAPPEPDNIAVYVGSDPVAKDGTNGWSYGGTSKTIIFNGSSCDLIKKGAAQVQVMFGCKGSPPPPLF